MRVVDYMNNYISSEETFNKVLKHFSQGWREETFKCDDGVAGNKKHNIITMYSC